MIRLTVLFLLVPTFAVAAPVPKEKIPVIDIRDPDGKVLLAAEDLVSYDWMTHTLTLKDGAKAPFAKALEAAGKFAVCIDGKPAFSGKFVAPTISSTRKGPVISLPEDFEEERGRKNKVVIDDGYGVLPGTYPDKRDVKELKVALEKAGKLKAGKLKAEK